MLHAVRRAAHSRGTAELWRLSARHTLGDLKHIFFVNSGSEAVDTTLKIALPYYLSRGEGPRTWFFGRERGYHGMGFDGVSVGGSAPNNKAFSGGLLPAIVHVPHTLNIKDAAVAGDLQHSRRPAGVREEPFNANPVGMLDSLISFACAPSRRT